MMLQKDFAVWSITPEQMLNNGLSTLIFIPVYTRVHIYCLFGTHASKKKNHHVTSKIKKQFFKTDESCISCCYLIYGKI